MKKFLLSGLTALAVASSPAVLAAQSTTPTQAQTQAQTQVQTEDEREAARDDAGALLRSIRDPLATALTLVGAAVLLYFLIDEFSEDGDDDRISA